jgi:hypothetical protein
MKGQNLLTVAHGTLQVTVRQLENTWLHGVEVKITADIDANSVEEAMELYRGNKLAVFLTIDVPMAWMPQPPQTEIPVMGFKGEIGRWTKTLSGHFLRLEMFGPVYPPAVYMRRITQALIAVTYGVDYQKVTVNGDINEEPELHYPDHGAL